MRSLTPITWMSIWQRNRKGHFHHRTDIDDVPCRIHHTSALENSWFAVARTVNIRGKTCQLNIYTSMILNINMTAGYQEGRGSRRGGGRGRERERSDQQTGGQNKEWGYYNGVNLWNQLRQVSSTVTFTVRCWCYPICHLLRSQ